VGVPLFRPPPAPEGSAFHVLNGVYLSMHPQNIEMLLQKRGEHYRLFAGFSGWAPGQLVFRADTSGLWEELVRKARGRVASR
jgi:putative AlgH/UPF0301 family transcriptional regulator